LVSLGPLILHFSQILTTLQLGDNEIGNQGLEYLAKALQQNNVKLISLLHSIESLIAHFLQTLTTLLLYYNEICAEGAKHLANALQHNKVTLISALCFL
jgi:Ran GTPase-activating protein (RanGAP) involved in mRNA processing and transport